MLHHVSLQVAGLGKGLVTHLALVGPHALVCEQVCVQVAQLLEQLPTEVTPMWFDAVVAQDVCDQVILRGVGLLTHPALPSLLVPADVHAVAVVYVNVEAELLWVACHTLRSFVSGGLPGAAVLSGVKSTRREVHDRPRHKEGIGESTVGERWEVGWVEKERGGGPKRRRTWGLLLHLHR